jgi:hypothetical protein
MEIDTVSRFELSPLPSGATNPAWGLSWQAAPCEILAETAEQARCLAAGQFTLAVHPGRHLECHRSPWLNPDLVQVVQWGA